MPKYLRVNKNTLVSLDRRDAASWEKVTSGKIGVFASILRENGYRTGDIRAILVLGTGNGSEAQCLAEAFPDAFVVAVDIADYRLPGLSGPFEFVQCDARRMPFGGSLFDLVYSYHTLEHIQNPEMAVAQAWHALRPGGIMYAGTPNKYRLLAYFNTPDVSIARRIQWNAREWADRLCFRWSNEKGAHAGFTRNGLLRLMAQYGFEHVRDVSALYFVSMYRSKTKIIRLLERTKLSEIVFPSVYCLAAKPLSENGNQTSEVSSHQSPERSCPAFPSLAKPRMSSRKNANGT